MSEYANVGALVGQGTIGGALGSQAVLDEGISGQFAHSPIVFGRALLQIGLSGNGHAPARN